MDSSEKDEGTRRESASSSERIIFYVDESSVETSQEPLPDYCQSGEGSFLAFPAPSSNSFRLDDRSLFYPTSADPTAFQLDERSILYLTSPEEPQRPCNSARSSVSKQGRNSRNGSDDLTRTARRPSVQSGRSRRNSCARPTPLGDGRRASTCKRTRSKRVSAARRKDSVRPARTALKEARKVIEDARELEQARRHRRIAMIVLGTFLFLLASSVLAVVVTLTHSSFLSPVLGSKELADHRAQLRRENEELINSLNREYVPENTTAPP